MTINEILSKFSIGEITIDEANKELKELDTIIRLDDTIPEGEEYGFLDDGISLKKVRIESDMTIKQNLISDTTTIMYVYYKDKKYQVVDDGEFEKLVEVK